MGVMSVHSTAQWGVGVGWRAKIDGFHCDKGNLITWSLIKHHSLSAVIKLPSVLLTSSNT